MFQALRRRHQLAGGAVEALGGPLQPPLLAARQRARRVHDAAQQLAARSAGQFRRRGRGGRAQVGHEVHDGEVGFMAHAADHRNGAGRDLARQRLVIEAPEIFNAAAAAHQQQGIHFGALIGQPHLRGQPAGRVGALHRGRIDDDGNLRRAPGQCRQHIAQRGRVQRGDHADRPGQRRQLALARRVEQPLERQLLLEPQKGFVQVAQPGPPHGVDLQLVVAARFVQRHARPDLDLVAGPRDEPHRAGAAAEHDRPHGGAAVLIVKYQCPEAACVKLEISPRTHIAGMLRSNNCPTAWFSWATVRISRANTLFVTENSIVIRLSGAYLSTGHTGRAAIIPCSGPCAPIGPRASIFIASL